MADVFLTIAAVGGAIVVMCLIWFAFPGQFAF